MLKSNFVDIYFETSSDRSAFDCWFESNDWTGYTSEEAIEKIDNFFEYDQYDEDFVDEDDEYNLYPIEDYTFGKNGAEYEYIESVKGYLKTLTPVVSNTMETE